MSNKIVESTTMTTTGNRNMMMETCLFISTSLVGLILMCLSLFIVTMDESRTNLFDDTLIQFNESQFHSITQTFFAVAIIATVDVLYDIKEAFKDSLKSKLWCMRFGLSLVYLATASLYFLLHSMPFTPAPTFQFVSTASTLVTSSLYILIILTTSPSTALSATSVALAFMQTLNSVFTFHNFLNPDNNDSSHSFLVENVVMYFNLVALLAYIGICAYNMYVGSVGSSKAKVGSTLIYITSLILPFVPVRAVFPTDSSLCASDKTQYLWRVYAACASTALLLVAARVDHMGDVESQVSFH